MGVSCPAQAVEALSASCDQDLQGLNTQVHCPENGQTVDLSEGAASLRLVITLVLELNADPCRTRINMQLLREGRIPGSGKYPSICEC